MLEETISKIHSAEARAREMVIEAEKGKTLSISRAHKEAESLLIEEEKRARQESRSMIENAVLSAEKERTEIETRSLAEIRSLLDAVKARIPEARKICR